MRPLSIAAYFAMVLCAAAPAVYGAPKTWLSAGGGNATNWNRGQNWNPTGAPGAADDIIIPTTPANGTGFPVLNASSTINTLTIQTGASLTGAAGFTLTVNGAATVTGTGALNVNASTMTFGGSITGTGVVNGNTGTLNVAGSMTPTTFNAGTGLVNYNGAGAQTVGAFTYNNLTFSGAGTKTTAAGTIGINGNWVVNGPAQLSTNNTVVNLTGGLSGNGNITQGTGTLSITGAWTNTGTYSGVAGATVNYNSGAAQAVSVVPSYQNLTFSGAGAKTPAAGTLSIAGNWSVTGGAATLSANNTAVNVTGNLTGTGNVTQGTGTISIGGNWTNTGTFSAPAGSTVNYNGGAAQAVSTGPAYQNLTFSGAGTKTTAAGTLSVAGNWSVGSTTALNTNNTTVNVTGNLTGAGSITQGSNLITLAGDWTHTGTFSASSAGVTLTGAAKQITGAAGGLTFTTLTVNGTYTNNNTGSGVTVSTALSGAGTLTQGTNAVLTISGTSGITALTATASPNTVTYNGSAAQTVKATTYHHLTINNSNASGVSITANTTVNGTLTLQQGIFSTGANTLITVANCAGSVSRPGGTPGHVVGRLQKTIPSGNSNCTFEVGTSSSAYTPIVTAYSSVTTGGNVLSTVATGDHPNIAGSGIEPTQSVNRYWTLTTPATGSLPSGGTYSATFNFLAGDVDSGASTAAFIVARYLSGTWFATTVGTRTATSTQATGLSAYGDFAVGIAGNTNFAREKQFIYTRELY